MFGMGKVYQKMFPTSIPENYENTLYHRYMSTLL